MTSLSVLLLCWALPAFPLQGVGAQAHPPLPPWGAPQARPPGAAFTASATSGELPHQVHFTDASTGLVTGWSWDFGDGATSSAKHPSHTYLAVGTYDVTLTVSGPGGADASTEPGLVDVLPPVIDPVVLVDATSSAGLGGLVTLAATSHAGGVAWIDYNGDYWPDLFITNGTQNPHWLFRNDGDGIFTDVSSLIPAKAPATLEEAGANFGDIDNDGDSDLFVCVDDPVPTGTVAGGPNLLYVNQGGAGFVEDAAARGLVDALGRRNIASGFADYDRDGFLDLYCGVWARLVWPLTFWDVLYRNDGGGSFAPVAAGTDGHGRNALTALWFDADLDGWPDLYVGNVGEFAEGYVVPESFDVLYRNDANGLTFSDVTLSGVIGDDATAAMGLDVGDVENDGDWDLYVTDNPVEGAPPAGNVLYLGDGSGGLLDNSCAAAGVCVVESSWPCGFADFNRDGWVDLWVGTTSNAVPEQLFLNQRDGTFLQAPQAPFAANETRGGSYADYDGDGDVDVCLWRQLQPVRLLENQGVDPNQWVAVKLHGTLSNRDAIGATVRVTAGGVQQMRRVSGGDSAHSQQELILHFGLEDEVECALEVAWPSGAVTSLSGIPAGQVVFVDEGRGLLGESLAMAECSWSRSSQILTVRVRSSFGGRTAFHALGLGALEWIPEIGAFGRSFAGVSTNPGRIALCASRGATFDLEVVALP